MIDKKEEAAATDPTSNLPPNIKSAGRDALEVIGHPTPPKMRSLLDLRGLWWPDWLRQHWLDSGASLSGITEPPVSQVLYSLVIANKPPYGLPDVPYVVVETGVRFGATACWLALAVNAIDGRYVGVEIEKRMVDGVNKLFTKQGLDKRARVVCGKAPDAVTGMFEQTSVDMFFVDDDHRAPHVKLEIKKFWPLLKPGGLMVFHDVVGDFPIWELVKDLGGIKLCHRQFNVFGQPPFGGLGVAQKPMG